MSQATRRRWIRPLGAALAVLIAAYLTVTIGTAHAADTLLSQGKTATASSTENATTPASAAVDGNTGTRWSSAFSARNGFRSTSARAPPSPPSR